MDEEVGRLDIAVDDIILVHYLQPIADLHENILNFRLAEPPSLRFHIRFQILLAVFEEEIEMFCSFGGLVELDDVGAFELEEDFDFPSDYFFVLDAIEGDGLDCQKLTFVVLDIAPVHGPEAALPQLDRRDHVPLNYLARHSEVDLD